MAKYFNISHGLRATMKSYALPTLPPGAGPRKYVDCVAVYTDCALWYVSRGEMMKEAITGVYERENSPCCSSSVSHDFLDKRCVRIDEATARKLHPALFQYMDQS